MRSKFAAACLAVLACLSVPSFLSAYAPQAEADFQAGRQFQAAQKWGSAVRAYLAALRDDPTLVRAYKDLGSVYYRLGSKRGALYYYDRYLAAVPDDAKVRAFDGWLRTSLGLPASAAPAPVHHDGDFQPGFDARVPLTFLFASAADVDKFYAVPPPTGGGFTATNDEPGSAVGVAGGVGLDYGLANGFVAGLDLLYGPGRSYSVSNSAAFDGTTEFTEKDTYGITSLSAMLTPGWRFKLGQNMLVEPRLGLGVMDTSVAFGIAFTEPGFPAENFSATSSGLGFAVWPEVRGEYLFGQIGVGVSLGYLYGTAAAQKYTSASSEYTQEDPQVAKGQPVQYQSSASGAMSNWSSQTEGLTFGLFVTYHFQPVFW